MLAIALSAAAIQPAAAANSRYAAIVVDANTGKVLYSANADSRRYPASLTKMMTLYLTFEALARGKINKNSPVVFSANAAAEPPTKLGVKAGGSVTVETAIYSLVTKSANDSATALGEMLGGSEGNFTRMMTAKARSLGMMGTVFRNANGLPNTGQFTTARDMATLGLALRRDFPQYFPYFATKSFAFGKRRINGHNRLIGRIKGVDGIKTGYTRASGFNLVSSVSDGNRRLVAVVMGGASGGARDNQMAALINEYMPQASSKRGGALVADAGASPLKALAKALLPNKDAPAPILREQDEEVVAEAPAPAQKPKKALVKTVAAEPVVTAYAEPPAQPKQAEVDPVSTASVPSSGWAIQVASSPSQSEAKAFLAAASKKASSALADASGYTVAFEKSGVTYYRARFGGFGSKTAAWNACGALKKKKIDCYAVQQ
jgi:D-alanyl-D-alanine carboxypeptidase